jgi:hypothetical protein
MPMNYKPCLLFMTGLWRTYPTHNLIGPCTLAVISHIPLPVPSTPLLPQQPPSSQNPPFLQRLGIPTQNHQLPIAPLLAFSPHFVCWFKRFQTFSNVSITFHTISKIHYTTTNHQIVPTQQGLLALKYTIFVATTYKLFDPGGIISSKSQSPCFSLPPDLRSQTCGGGQCSLCFPGFPYPL